MGVSDILLGLIKNEHPHLAAALSVSGTAMDAHGQWVFTIFGFRDSDDQLIVERFLEKLGVGGIVVSHMDKLSSGPDGDGLCMGVFGKIL